MSGDMGTTVINKPPTVFKRNQYGLLEDKAVEYQFNVDGTVNWRKMIKPEFLVANRDRTDETDISKLEDNELIILLSFEIKSNIVLNMFLSIQNLNTLKASFKERYGRYC